MLVAILEYYVVQPGHYTNPNSECHGKQFTRVDRWKVILVLSCVFNQKLTTNLNSIELPFVDLCVFVFAF